MKRIFILLLTLAVFVCGCSERKSAVGETEPEKKETRAGIWISFSEINSMLNSEKGFEAEFSAMLDNCEEIGTDDVYVHIRSYCDSLFKSEYFPLIEEAKKYDFDIFEYIVNEIHNRGMAVHAWINPYRVLTSSEDIEKLSQESPAYKWLKDETAENDKNVCFANGIYLNPAESEVRNLVINGIREVIDKYEVDGIHFDDYFYPTIDPAFDSASYEKYCSLAELPLSLEKWRRANVNALISGCYTAIKFMDKDIVFSVSPMASVEKNYSELYADVAVWIENGCVDVIIPQIYFGFEYPDSEFRFENLLSIWKKLNKSNSEVELMIGLAPYKIGTDTAADTAEWCGSDDIIARQVKMCIEDGNISGYVLFSATGIFSEEDLNTRQKENLVEVIED